MIYGIGIDIVYIPRILRIMQKYGYRFLHRVYTKEEIEISNKYDNPEIQARYLSTRFAAKEAFVKALGTGFSQNIQMKHIEICNNINGKPYVVINQGLIVENNAVHLSISDEKDYATAFVIIQTTKI